MKPVYFPLTFIEKEKTNKISSVFNKTYLYIPSRKIEEEYLNTNAFKFKFPEQYQEKINALFQGYITWANINEKELYFLLQNEEFNKTIISEIKTNIKNFNEKTSSEKNQDIIKAGLFLYIAHRTDKQTYEAQKDLNKTIEMEQKISFEITGQNNYSSPYLNSIPNQDIGALMTKQRIESWIRLFLQDNLYTKEKLIFITDSFECADYLKNEKARYLIISNPDPNDLEAVGNETLISYVRSLKTNIFKEYIIIKKPPETFFGNIIGKTIEQKGIQTNTIIGVF